jgi:Lar family restriction alleviation protein
MGDELKPCPFCGGKAKVGSRPEDWGRYDAKYRIECEKCEASSGWYNTRYSENLEENFYKKRAIEAWNKRSCQCQS